MCLSTGLAIDSGHCRVHPIDSSDANGPASPTDDALKPISESPKTPAGSEPTAASAAARSPVPQHQQPGWWSRWTFSYVDVILDRARQSGSLGEHDADYMLPPDLDTHKLALQFEEAAKAAAVEAAVNAAKRGHKLTSLDTQTNVGRSGKTATSGCTPCVCAGGGDSVSASSGHEPWRWSSSPTTRALLQLHWPELLHLAAVTLLETARMTGAALLLRQFLRWLEEYDLDPGLATVSEGWAWMAGLLACITLRLYTGTTVFWIGRLTYLAIQQQLVVAIHNKMLRLTTARIQAADFSAGQIVNLINTDVTRLENALALWSFAFVGPLQVLVVCLLISLEMDVSSAIAGVVFPLIVIPMSSALARLATGFRENMADGTDARLQVLAEVVDGILAVKMLSLEGLLGKQVKVQRSQEEHWLRRSNRVRAVLLASEFCVVPLAALAAFAVYRTSHSLLSTASVFYVLALLNLTRKSGAMFVPAVQSIAEALVSLRRIDAFLWVPEPPRIGDDASQHNAAQYSVSPLLPETAAPETSDVVPIKRTPSPSASPIKSPSSPQRPPRTSTGFVVVNGVDYDWSQPSLTLTQGSVGPATPTSSPRVTMECKAVDGAPDQLLPTSHTLQRIQFKACPGELLAVTGATGSGKSTLLAGLRGELDPLPPGPPATTDDKAPQEDELSAVQRASESLQAMAELNGCGTYGRLAFCAQRPWIAAGTVHDNIVFYCKWDEQLYKRVLYACCLDDDLANLPQGDQTELGEGGGNLSGGQRARIALARACYSRPAVALLDDPLSAVDPRVANDLFERAIGPGGLLDELGATRILVTHQVQFLPRCDRVLVLKDGKIVSCGVWKPMAVSMLTFAGLAHRHVKASRLSNKTGPDAATTSSEGASRYSATGYSLYGSPGYSAYPKEGGGSPAVKLATHGTEGQSPSLALRFQVVRSQGQPGPGTDMDVVTPLGGDDSDVTDLTQPHGDTDDDVFDLREAPSLVDGADGTFLTAFSRAGSRVYSRQVSKGTNASRTFARPYTSRVRSAKPASSVPTNGSRQPTKLTWIVDAGAAQTSLKELPAVAPADSTRVEVVNTGTASEEDPSLDERSVAASSMSGLGPASSSVVTAGSYGRAKREGNAASVVVVAASQVGPDTTPPGVDAGKLSAYLHLKLAKQLKVQTSNRSSREQKLSLSKPRSLIRILSMGFLGRTPRGFQENRVSPLSETDEPSSGNTDGDAGTPGTKEIHLVEDEDNESGGVSWAVYGSFCRLVGPILVVLLLVIFSASQTVSVLYGWWLARWSTAAPEDADDRRWLWMLGLLASLVIFTMVLRSILFFEFLTSAATRLHRKGLAGVLHAPLSFFHVNPSSRILNRFSKDLGRVDDQLPLRILVSVQYGFQVLSTVVLVGIALPVVLALVVPLGIYVVLIRSRYLTGSVEIERLEARTKAPLASSVLESFKGLETIRAFRASRHIQAHFLDLLAMNSTWLFAVGAASRWITLRLDAVSVAAAMAAITFAMIMRDKIDIAVLALALTDIISMVDIMSFFGRQTAAAANQMTSVERLLAYTHLPSEEGLEPASTPRDDSAVAITIAVEPAGAKPVKGLPAEASGSNEGLHSCKAVETVPPTGWPKNGELRFEQVSACYRPGLPPVLRDLSFTIPAGTSCGVVGRTGSGKSSLMLTVFRLIPITGGTIFLDGVDTGSVCLSRLRKVLAIIPQDPVLFCGTLRSNLNPLGRLTDPELWEALDRVQLRSALAALAGGGLDTPVSEGGFNLSVGQRQLLCVARAVLQGSKLLALDEATANVDQDTDEVIQEAVYRFILGDTDGWTTSSSRSSSSGRVLLTIAHRISSVMHADRLLVLGDGQLLESGPPQELAAGDGVFATMVAASRHMHE